MSILHSLYQYNPFANCYTHQYSLKKDDDISIQKAQNWIRSNPIHLDSIRCLDIYQSQEYGKKIVQELKKFDVDSSNEEIIKDHLVKICIINDLVKQYFLKHFSEIGSPKHVMLSV